MEVRKSLVVNATPLETRIALLENGQVCELFIERGTGLSQVGHIYKGRVAKVLPGMQSAFVALGTPKDGFLYLDDAQLPRMESEEGEAAPELEEPLPALPPVVPPKEGEDILVQVIKDPLGNKGPRVTRHLTFPGRFLVFMPGIDHIGISRKITDPAERERLKVLIKSHAQSGEGFIVRTAAIGEKDEDLVGDVAFLRQIWQDMQERAATAPVPSLVHQDLGLVQKVARDLFREEVTSFWVDDPQVREEIAGFIQKLHPEWVDRVKHFTSDLPIFEAFGIEQEIDKATRSKVLLKNGGSIVINQTEALVSVDVNTGRFVGGADLEETVFQNNLKAIPEIVRQLRLRNLGGIVVIDFIDMLDEAHRAEVLALLNEELRRDRNHARALGISEFGVVEMTRKRARLSLERQLTQPCPTCHGSGRVISPETAMLKVYRELARQGERLRGRRVVLTIHPEMAPALQKELREGLGDLVHGHGARIHWIEKDEAPRDAVAFEVQG